MYPLRSNSAELISGIERGGEQSMEGESTDSECIYVRGVVEHGDHRGRTLGFPTANLYTGDDQVLPPDGVYGGYVRQLGASPRLLGASAISVGTNPTFGAHARRLEAHIIDFDEDIYGETIEVEIGYRVRGMVTFANVDELITTMRDDVAQCRRRSATIVPFASRR